MIESALCEDYTTNVGRERQKDDWGREIEILIGCRLDESDSC